MTAKKGKWTIDSDGLWVSFLVEDRAVAQKAIADMVTDKLYDVTVKQHKNIRSRNANNYFHALVNEIANKTGMSDKKVKRDLDARTSFSKLKIQGELAEGIFMVDIIRQGVKNEGIQSILS